MSQKHGPDIKCAKHFIDAVRRHGNPIRYQIYAPQGDFDITYFLIWFPGGVIHKVMQPDMYYIKYELDTMVRNYGPKHSS